MSERRWGRAGEEWRQVEGWPGYEVSSLGRVRSVGRVIMRSNGIPQTVRTRILSAATDPVSGYLRVGLYLTGMRRRTLLVHVLVARAFHGKRPEGCEVRHLDGNGSNCAATNLAYGTSSENNWDQIAHGRHAETNQRVCLRGHLLAQPNLTPCRLPVRQCLACVRAISYRRRHRDEDLQQLSDRYYRQIMAARLAAPPVLEFKDGARGAMVQGRLW